MAAVPSRDAEAFAAHWARIRSNPDSTLRTIVADDVVVGNAVSWTADEGRMVGYWIGKEHWGRGFASAGLVLFLDVDRHRPLLATVVEHNVGSRRVLEKAGFQFVARKLGDDGPEPGVAPWSADEVRDVVEMAHLRGAKVTAHSGDLAGARVCVAGGVDSIEHGMELDADAAAGMAAAGIALVSTLTVFRSWSTFAATTALSRFGSPDGRARIAARFERAKESVRLARYAGVAIATGTDFGGGSSRVLRSAFAPSWLR